MAFGDLSDQELKDAAEAKRRAVEASNTPEAQRAHHLAGLRGELDNAHAQQRLAQQELDRVSRQVMLAEEALGLLANRGVFALSAAAPPAEAEVDAVIARLRIVEGRRDFWERRVKKHDDVVAAAQREWDLAQSPAEQPIEQPDEQPAQEASPGRRPSRRSSR